MTAGPLAQQATAARRASEGSRSNVRWLIVALVVVTGAVVVALLYTPPAAQYLSPGSTAPSGSHALADVLATLHRRVQTATTVSSAVAAAPAGTTLVITSPGLLSPAGLRQLARDPANVLLVGPGPAALAALAPGVTITGPPSKVTIVQPRCTLRAAVLAGSVDSGGGNLRVRAPGRAVAQCYPSASGETLVQLRVRGRLMTVLGAGDPLTNADLASQGNAALALNLLPTPRIIWLVPRQANAAPPPAGSSKSRSFVSVVPRVAYLVAAQLGLAALLTAAWRARRLGPLTAESLPVVVHAAETVIGHGRLYQARRARGKAAAALRGSLLARLAPAVGLPAGTSGAAMVAVVAQRTAWGQDRIRTVLYGPVPGTDAGLLALARDLDTLAREAGLS